MPCCEKVGGNRRVCLCRTLDGVTSFTASLALRCRCWSGRQPHQTPPYTPRNTRRLALPGFTTVPSSPPIRVPAVPSRISLSGVALLAVWLAAKHTCSYVAGDVPQRSFERGRACERAWGCREFSFYIRAVGYQLLLLCAPRQDALASKYRAGIYLLSKISRPRQGCVKSGACPGPHRSSKSMMTTVPAPFFPLSALSLDATAPAMRLPSRSQHTS